MTNYIACETISVSISLPAEEVYDFAHDLGNFPKWVSYCTSIKKEETGWVMETPYSLSSIQVTKKNPYLILDHVTSPDPGVEIIDAMRVIPNGAGCTVLLTGYQLPGMSDEKFSEAILTGKKDLEALKTVLEN
ncbi:SRPBCC family protein [Metabacillus sp. RGM 3146]|uniref:SRPBCC family protein n=1 Tax=Metabacillus sp. RGM 3146 TaxID=3401092 RepID=UPI003B9AFE9D